MNRTITIKKKDCRFFHSTTLFLFLFSVMLNAQTGVVLDSPADDTIPQFLRYDGDKGNLDLKKEISLRRYCPKVYDRGNTYSCMAFAFCYGGFSILKNVKAKRNDYRYSAAFMFNLIEKESKGIKLSKAINFIKDKGFCLEPDFPNSNIHGTEKPHSDLQIRAKANAISVQPIDTALKGDDRTQEIKKYLCDLQPVVVIAKIESDFKTKCQNAKMWTPNVTEIDPEHHAMVIVGYKDNGSNTIFELMNCDGEKWGEQGFIKVKDKDLELVIARLYAFRALGRDKGMDGETDSVHIIDSTQLIDITHFQLKKRVKIGDSKVYKDQIIQAKDSLNPYFYETQDLSEVNSLFQIHTMDMPEGKKLYAFSLDSSNKITIHTLPEFSEKTGLLDTNVLIIPTWDSAIKVIYGGQDQIVMLIADKEIADFKERLANKFIGNTIHERLKAAFGDILMPPENIVYKKEDMKVKNRIYPSSGWVVPIILAIRMDNK
jgi:hypothetical protein